MESIVTRCPGCGAKNRIPVAKLGDAPACGRCKGRLEPASSPIYAVDADFDLHVANWKGVVLADFYAVWCGPCKALAPTLETLAAERIPGLKIIKINVDEEPLSAFKFKVRSVPTLVLFKNGAPAETLVGNQPLAALRAAVTRHLA